MKRKDNIYKLYQQQVRDKDTAVTEFYCEHVGENSKYVCL